MREETLRMERVTYMDPSGAKLTQFDLSIFSGEIMGLVPVKGHGLTALLSVLQHNLPLQKGYIYYREECINTWKRPRSQNNRIAVIGSHSGLVDGLTVSDNIFVLRPGFRTWIIKPSVLHRQLQPFLDEIDVGLSGDSYIDELTSFQRFVVELVKAIVRGCRLIILRDVSTFISESERADLYRVLRHYVQKGVSFLYTGYHLEELAQICDRIALMSNGRITAILPKGKKGTPYADGFDEKVRKQWASEKQNSFDSQPVMIANHLTGGALQDLSFALHKGECLVLQDYDNRVLDDLKALITGKTSIESGELTLDGNPYQASRKLAFVSQNPTVSMMFSELSCFDNLCFTVDHRLKEVWLSRKMKQGIQKQYQEKTGKPLVWRNVQSMTRQQKYELIYHRILLQNPKVLFCEQPFREADMVTRMRIWELLEELMAKGIAIVILAVNLSDSLSLANRLIRLKQDGHHEEYTREQFGQMHFDAPWVNVSEIMKKE